MELPQPVQESLLQVIAVSGHCIRQGVELPSLILVYSCIDALGWLAVPDPAPTPQRTFTAWVDRWMLPASPLPCTSLDLYAARCGVLHTLTANSKLATQGKARTLVYTWGGASVAELQRKMDAHAPDKVCAVDIDALWDGLRLGTAQFFEDAAADPDLSAVVGAKAATYFTFIRPEM